jgi:hypothetical protein
MAESADASDIRRYTGTVLCMNLRGRHKVEGEFVGKQPKKEETHDALLRAFDAAVAACFAPPAAILLQEYEWPKVQDTLDELDAKVGGPGAWSFVRSFDVRDTMVLVNTSVYTYANMSSGEAHGIRESDGARFKELRKVAGKKELDYRGRWSGVYLGVLGAAVLLQFRVISYHGCYRKPDPQSSQSSTPGGRLLSQDFIIAAGRAGARDALLKDTGLWLGTVVNVPFGPGMPTLVGGDWNSDHGPTFDELLPRTWVDGKNTFTYQDHKPDPLPSGSVRPEYGDGGIGEIDYAVSITPAAAACALHVLRTQALAHSEDDQDAGYFDHDPFVIEFCVAPAALTDEAEAAARAAAAARAKAAKQVPDGLLPPTPRPGPEPSPSPKARTCPEGKIENPANRPIRADQGQDRAKGARRAAGRRRHCSQSGGARAER